MVRPVVRRFDIEVGHCSQCQRRVQGRHVLQTSDALGAAGVQLGPGVVALVVELHTEMGVPLAKVAHLLRTTFLQVTPGGLAHVLHRAARAAAPAYAELCEQVRNAPVVTPDETGWRVGGVRHWLWTFVTPDTTVYAICPGRGFNDAATVLGTDYVGVLVRDGWTVSLLRRTAPNLSEPPSATLQAAGRTILTVPGPARCRRFAGRPRPAGPQQRGSAERAMARPAADSPPGSVGWSTHRRRSTTPSASRGTWPPNSRPCSSSCGTPRSTPPTGAPNRPSGPLWSSQGVRRQPHPPRRDTQQVLASVVRTARQLDLDRRARRRTRRPRAPGLPAAPVGGHRPNHGCTRDRSRRRAAGGPDRTALVATGLRRNADACALPPTASG